MEELTLKKKTIKKRDERGQTAASKIGQTGKHRELQLLGT